MLDTSVLLSQLGGIGRLKAMIGATDFIKSANYLMFSFKGCRKANKIMISIKNDLYQVTFYKWQKSKMELATVSVHNDVTVENLKSLIENVTGLALSL